MQEPKKIFLKSKRIWKVIGIIVLVFIAYSVGNSGAEVTLEDEKVTYTELSNKIAESEEKLDKVKKSKQHQHVKVVKDTFEVDAEDIVIPFSAETGEGNAGTSRHSGFGRAAHP